MKKYLPDLTAVTERGTGYVSLIKIFCGKDLVAKIQTDNPGRVLRDSGFITSHNERR